MFDIFIACAIGFIIGSFFGFSIITIMIISKDSNDDRNTYVQCGDCKYLSSDRIAPDWNRICRKYGFGKPDDGYCDEGERKETENGNS